MARTAASSAPLFHPLSVLRGRGRILPAPARGTSGLTGHSARGYGTDVSVCSLTASVAGLNSTPALTCTFILVICLQALKVSYKHCVNQRDRKGKVSRMRSMAVSVGSRSAASLAATFSALVGYVELSGGSG